MRASLYITRQVLFEKFNIKHEMRDFLLSRIEGCEIKYLKKYPDSTFFVKNDRYMFEQDRKISRLWVRYDVVWSVFESKYQLSYKQIQVFITDTLENQLKMEGLTPMASSNTAQVGLENRLKMEGLTPFTNSVSGDTVLENQLKMEGLTPMKEISDIFSKLENQLRK